MNDRRNLDVTQYRLVIEHAPTMIWRADAEGACDYFNPAWLAFTGRSAADELGDGWTAGIHPDDREARFATYRDHAARRRPFESEYRLRRHDGVYRYVLDRAAPYVTDGGRFAGFIGACIDVDDRRCAEYAKATFLEVLAHDLRTPLTSVKAYVEAVRRKVRAGTAIDDDIFLRVAAQIDRFAGLIGDLADIARLEQGRDLAVALNDDVDLAALARDAVRDGNEGATRGASGGPPPSIALEIRPGAHHVRGDRRRLEQAVRHLVDNAVKFSPQGGPVRIAVEPGADSCSLTIADTGIGIPTDELPLVTRCYFRASNAPAEQYPGVGRGLTIARQIVERHGGTLHLASEPGRGSVVSVALPYTCPQ